MKKGIIAFSAVAALATTSFASTSSEMASQLEMLKKQIEALEAKLSTNTKSLSAVVKDVKKNQKKIKKTTKKLNVVKAHDAKDNIKWDVDFRTAADKINYTTASGKSYGNDALLTNRLNLNMAYAPNENTIFKGALGYHKVYGAAPAVNGMPQRGYGYDTFDWIANETASSDKVTVKEAYWLYMNDTFLGMETPWTASFGRRPSTNGFLTNLRNDTKAQSPLGHTIDVEFDGASFKWNLDKVTGVDGMYWKLCLGRGLSDATPRFDMSGGLNSFGDYSESTNSDTLETIDLAGFIFVPYDDGQYKIETTYYKANNLPGFTMANGDVNGTFALVDGTSVNNGMVSGIQPNFVGGKFVGMSGTGMNSNVTMKTMGDLNGAAVSLKVDGIGNGISDFLDETTFFASYAMSKTNPDNKQEVMNLSAFDGFVGKTTNEMAFGMIAMGMQAQGAVVDANNPTPAEAGAILTALNAAYTAELGVGNDVAFDAGGGLTGGGTISSTSATLGATMVASANAMPTVTSGMLGSNESQKGHSVYLGIQMPAMFTDDGRIGLEWNKGSKYWRSFTYAEDTMAGSKLAARGSAVELYYIQPINNALTFQARYTSIKYDYTGSQAFFGDDGSPYTMAEAKAFGMDPIEKASDLRVSMSYKF